MKTILASAAIAIVVGLYAIHDQYAQIRMQVVAEDDCPYYYGIRDLDAVKREADGKLYCVYGVPFLDMAWRR